MEVIGFVKEILWIRVPERSGGGRLRARERVWERGAQPLSHPARQSPPEALMLGVFLLFGIGAAQRFSLELEAVRIVNQPV